MRIGVDLGGTKIEAIALDDNGIQCARARIAAPQQDYEATIRAVAGLVGRVAAEANAAQFSVGVGMPGALNPRSRLVQNSNSTWLIGKPFDRDLETALGLAVRCANDANCFALSEAVDGAGKDGRTVFGVIIGTGVGGGLVIDKAAQIGPNAIAGEWGHLPLPWASEAQDGIPQPCYCGLKGCIETHLSGPSLARHYRRIGGSGNLEANQIAAQTGADASAQQAIEDYAERLARALALVINIADPDVIVLGGGVSNVDYLYQRVPQLWAKWAMIDDPVTQLRRNEHGDASGVRGAAWLWNDKGRGDES